MAPRNRKPDDSKKKSKQENENSQDDNNDNNKKNNNNISGNSSASTERTSNVERKRSSRGLPWWCGILAAIVSLGVGLFTPPFLLQLDSMMMVGLKTSTSSRDRSSAAATDTVPNDHGTMKRKLISPENSCSDHELENFWHDSAVPGFHIVCVKESSSSSPTTHSSHHHHHDHLELTFYPEGTRDTKAQAQVKQSIPWPELQNIFAEILQLTPADEMHQEWAVFSSKGELIVTENARHDESIIEQFVQSGLLLVFQGGQFLWPGVRIGFQREAALYSIMPKWSPEFPSDKNRTVTLETLSLSPLVVSVKGFLSDNECTHIQDKATPSMQYSGVVLMDRDAGRPASDFRTSQTTFLSAHGDPILTEIDFRTASLVRIPRNHQEPVQVLRYGETEKYNAHMDFFDPQHHQNDKNTLALIGHGRRNRMATVFWYLSDVEEGGETVFPRFNGRKERGTTDCEGGLKVKPERGKVIIFYSMTADGKTDDASLHGACPVKKGIKWAANKWVWNEPMRYV